MSSDNNNDKRNEQMTIRVSGHREELHFKLNPSSTFSKLIERYCDKYDLKIDQTTFTFDG
jgi:hypothetical protein